MRKYLIFILTGLILSGCVRQPIPSPTPSPGSNLVSAPSFELDSLDGEVWSLQDLQGDVVVLYFWTTTCPTCIAKLPDLAILQEQLPGDVHLLLLNGGDSVSAVRRRVNDYPNLNVLMDAKGVFAPYGVRYVPTTIFIDGDGMISQGYIGPIPNDEILEIIDGLK